MISRRQCLKGIGAGSALLSPLVQSVAAQVEGADKPRKRFVFVMFENGFWDYEAQPEGVPLGGEKFRELPLKPLTLPKRVIEPFTSLKDRLLIIQGLRGNHLSPDHGAGFGALSGVYGGPAEGKRRVLAETIDAALARAFPAIFPIVALGINPGSKTTTAYATSAWGRGRPIPIQCRPELAYESLFGSAGTDRNDFLSRKEVLDFVGDDFKRLRSDLGGPRREQLDYHLEALESLSKRWGKVGAMKDGGKLARHAPKLPAKPPELMPDIIAAQFDIAAAALTSGLTNVVTITSGLGRLSPSYKGFSNMGQHAAGHNEPDHEQGVRGGEIVRRAHRFMAERTAKLVKTLQSIPEGKGTMMDNTLVVFMSDSANRQHTDGMSWPVALIGDLGGRLKTGRLVVWPMKTYRFKNNYDGPGRGEGDLGKGTADNPTLNRLYCTLLHAAGAPREHFNLTVPGLDKHGPIQELLG